VAEPGPEPLLDGPEPLLDGAARLPAPALRRFVAGYTGYRMAGLAPGSHRGLPSPFLTVIFTLDDPLEITAHPDPRQPAGSYRTLIGGLHRSPVMITHPGRQSGIQIALRPSSARALFGLPAGELAAVDLDLADLIGPTAERWHERLRATPTWPARFDLLDRVLLARLDQLGQAAVPRRLEAAWRLLTGPDGAPPVVRRVAEEVGWSERHLLAVFRREVGLSPKAAVRVARFHRARRQLFRTAATSSLAEVAAWAGYYDQAHLARDFRELAGCSPSRLLAEELRYPALDGAQN
jgi:AraC-like DNA-binding protein